MNFRIKRLVILLCSILLFLPFYPPAAAADSATVSPRFIQISSQSAGHALLLKDDGTVWAWGQNEKGQLGDGTTTFRSTLIQVKGLPKVKQVLASMEFSAALAENGDLYTWGDNQYGQSGQMDAKYVLIPTFLMSDVAYVSFPNRQDALVLKTDGSIWGWGWAAAGPNPADIFGNSPMNAHFPIEYTPNHQFLSLVKDYLAAPDGEVVQYIASGRGYQLQPQLKNKRVVGASWSYVLLGDGVIYTRKTQTSFFRFSNMSNFVSLKGDDPHGALDTSGNLWMWGDNGFGQLGNGKVVRVGPNSNEKVLYKSLTKVVDYAVNDASTYAIRSDGTVWGWGSFPINNERVAMNRQVYPKWLFDANGDLHISTPSVPFGDLKGHKDEQVIRSLLAKGIIKGYEDNTFRPTDIITREEFIQWIVVSQGWPHSKKTTAYGDDMPVNHWANEYIAAALDHGVLKLTDMSLLYPDEALGRLEMALWAGRALKLKGESPKIKIVDRNSDWDWWSPEIVQAVVNRGIVRLNSKGALDYSDTTRADAAFTIYKMMQIKK
ncbi:MULTISPECIES: S-layer homology domain-containing protein [Paenibacillus]|uniref:S-layer homology domain-containing protein n=1 Tax=Paenibacillus TaxID=44249 RepID=UPI00096E5116|nr:S-layer homology domain-containing protein [Paenibacillus odorifer]OME13960.1 hypothetical protein BSK60_13990 [Paenibacillus odorifer]